MAKKRDEIDDRYKWHVAEMYPDEADWETDYARVLEMAAAFPGCAGSLSENGRALLEAFRARDELWRQAEHLFVYARMRRDEDNAAPAYQALTDRAQSLLAKVAAQTAFFVPELTEIPKERMDALREQEPALETQYAYVLLQIERQSAHTLPGEQETLLAQLGEALDAPGEIFTMLNDADMAFGEVLDEDGQKRELTHASYIRFLESKNRDVRRGAYEALYRVYEAHKNTLAASYGYAVKTDAITARIRNYPSALTAALSGGDVPEAVYTSLIEAVNGALPAHHRYLALRRGILAARGDGPAEGEKLAMYDVYAPLTDADEQDVSFEEAVSIMTEALAPLGKAYTDKAREGALSGWVDVYENEGKSSGAYSFGSYDSMPFILMNFTGKLKDVFTLVHEMGHSMHSYYTRGAQPFTYGSHSIFTAEVASTVNENLLVRYLLSRAKDERERAQLLNLFLEEYRTTVFRQTMFAEFEKQTHEAVEHGEALTCETLSAAYGALNEKYFGDSVFTDGLIRLEWSRIPHFYRAFYVYQYATGFSAASAIAERILADPSGSAAKDYLRFLETGNSDDPIELLRIAGIHMDRPDTVRAGLKMFEELVTALEALLS